MGKFFKALLCASLLVSMVSFIGCGKETAKASTDSVTSVSVEEEIKQTEEEVKPSVLIEDFYDPEKVYVFLNETEEAILSITKEYLVACGKLDASDKLFFSSSSDFQNAVGPQMKITHTWDYQMLSFTLKDGSLDKIFVTDVVRSGSENGEKLKSVKVCDMEEYVKAIEETGDEYIGIVPYSFCNTLDAPISYLRALDMADVISLIDDAEESGALTRDSALMDYIYAKAPDINLYKNPEEMVANIFPFISTENLRWEKTGEFGGYVIVSDESGEQAVEVKLCRKTADGDYLYTIGAGNMAQYSDRHEAIAIIDSATPEKLKDALPFCNSEFPDKPYYVVDALEDGSATLYGLNEHSGYILQVGDEIIPVYDEFGFGRGVEFHVSDYDNDGNLEYAFTSCSGSGTGYYTETLFIVDLDEERKVTWFESAIDIKSENPCIYDCVKFDYDKETRMLNYYLLIGDEKSNEGSLELSEEFVGGREVTDIFYGDQFFVTFDNNKLGFVAKSGINLKGLWTMFEYSVDLIADLDYKDGKITYGNVRLAPNYPEE